VQRLKEEHGKSPDCLGYPSVRRDVMIKKDEKGLVRKVIRPFRPVNKG
jgi:hypothetical protein